MALFVKSFFDSVVMSHYPKKEDLKLSGNSKKTNTNKQTNKPPTNHFGHASSI